MGNYIKNIFVHDIYVNKNFSIGLSSENCEFHNLILTGKNGSGKTTLLKEINRELFKYKTGLTPLNPYFNFGVSYLEEQEGKLGTNPQKIEIQLTNEADLISNELLVVFIPTLRLFPIDVPERGKKLSLQQVLTQQSSHIHNLKNSYIQFANLQKRVVDLDREIIRRNEVVVRLEAELKSEERDTKVLYQNKSNQINSERTQIVNKTNELEQVKQQILKFKFNDSTINPAISLSKYFLQYLIDAKEKQAFAYADEDLNIIDQYNVFFKKIESFLQDLYEDTTLRMRYVYKENNFYFDFANGNRADFNQIADGFKSVLIIIAEIMLQRQAHIDDLKTEVDPSGIVIIDELEAHLHLSAQQKILPALVSFFPKLQFVIATHSPHICASDDNSFLYDLTSKKLESEYVGGFSYDVISKSHFGLKSEYSLKSKLLLETAESLMDKVELSVSELQKLNQIRIEISKLSPELTYELELFLRKKNKDGKL